MSVLQMLYQLFPGIVGLMALIMALNLGIIGFKKQPMLLYLSIILYARAHRILMHFCNKYDLLDPQFYFITVLGAVQFLVPAAIFLHLSIALKGSEKKGVPVWMHFIPAFIVFIFLILSIASIPIDMEFGSLAEYTLFVSNRIISARMYLFSFSLIGVFYVLLCLRLISRSIRHGALIGELGRDVFSWLLYILMPSVIILTAFLTSLIHAPNDLNFTLVGSISDNAAFIRALLIAVFMYFVYRFDSLKISRFYNPEYADIPSLESRVDTEISEKHPGFWKSEADTENIQLAHSLYQNQSNINNLINKIEVFVQSQFPFRNTQYGLEQLSSDLNIPLHHLRYIFKYHHQHGFVDYRNYKRCEDLIKSYRKKEFKNKKLEAVAMECGFGSQSAMFRAFKKLYNSTPNELFYDQLLDESNK